MPIVLSPVAALAPLVVQLVSALAPVLMAVAPLIAAVVPLVTAVAFVLQPAIESLLPVISTIFAAVDKIVWASIAAIVSGALSVARAVITVGLTNVARLWQGAWTGLHSFVGGIRSGNTGAVSGGVTSLLGFLGSIDDRRLDGLGHLTGILTSVGRNLFEGLIEGVTRAMKSVVDAMLRPIKDSADKVKDALGIHSPSHVMEEAGEEYAAASRAQATS